MTLTVLVPSRRGSAWYRAWYRVKQRAFVSFPWITPRESRDPRKRRVPDARETRTATGRAARGVVIGASKRRLVNTRDTRTVGRVRFDLLTGDELTELTAF